MVRFMCGGHTKSLCWQPGTLQANGSSINAYYVHMTIVVCADPSKYMPERWLVCCTSSWTYTGSISPNKGNLFQKNRTLSKWPKLRRTRTLLTTNGRKQWWPGISPSDHLWAVMSSRTKNYTSTNTRERWKSTTSLLHNSQYSIAFGSWVIHRCTSISWSIYIFGLGVYNVNFQ